MNKILRQVGLCVIFLLGFRTTMAEDYRWIITYPTATNEWGRKMASGENKTVMKLQFIDLDSENDYKITQFHVRPFTDQAQWYIESVQLWVNTDNYTGGLDQSADSLIDTQNLAGIGFVVQSAPTNRVAFTLPGGEWLLSDTTTFFVTMEVQDWTTADPEDLEITGQHGARLGITVDKDQDDILVATTTDDFSKISNNWAGDITKLFNIQAVNLPVYIFNRNGTAEEDTNMFYSKYLEINGNDTSKAQNITDLTIEAHAFLPHLNIVRGDSLSYASFKMGWSNHCLELDSIAFGDLWDDKQYQENGWDGSGYGVSTLPGDTTFSVVRFEAIVMGNSTSPQNYVDIANNSIAVFYFKVIKPGVSPLFLSDILILDQWGIPYHTYRQLQNDADATADKYDAWSKQILGDFTGTISGDLNDGNCDGRIDPLTDISLFSNYIWMNSDSADWYARFDVGDSASHDPDVLSPDDTTNFFDLMVIGSNYYRTLQGEFNQKTVVNSDEPVVNLSVAESLTNSGQYSVQIDMRHIPEFISAQIKLRFDPDMYQFQELHPGEWTDGLSPQSMWLYSPEELRRGILDINFLALDQPISGDGKFVALTFLKTGMNPGEIRLDYIDLRDVNCQQIALNVDSDQNAVVPSEYFLIECYPNPFNPSAHLSYTVPAGGEGVYRVAIYDLRGNLVKELSNRYYPAGYYKMTWNGLNNQLLPVSSGIYIIRLDGKQFSKIFKITLMR
ncbi:MAG: T9SS type A sorting domain-containing protein [Candidatus Marinimicrobia bacterium]|nr:T9SS type A sorting domain-containing protein [Candidatus Neomarinimicrobiota bacterium]